MKTLIALLLLAGTAVCDTRTTLDSLDAAGAMQAELELAQLALERHPGDCSFLEARVRARINLAEEAMDAGREEEASQGFDQALEGSAELVRQCKERSMAHYYRALALGRRALFAGGREKVELSQGIERSALHALELDPDNGRAHGLIGRYYREMATLSWFLRKVAETLYGELPEGGVELSAEHLRRAVALEPEWVFAHFELAETLELLKQPAEAREHYRRALALPSTDHRDPLLKEEARRRLEKLGN